MGTIRQQAQQIALGAARLGEDDGLLRCIQSLGLGEGDPECLEQGTALRVVVEGGGESGEGVQVGDLTLQGGPVGFAQRLR